MRFEQDAQARAGPFETQGKQAPPLQSVRVAGDLQGSATLRARA